MSSPNFPYDEKDVHISASILLDHVAQYIGDRRTWNALVSVNKELYSLSKSARCGTGTSAPWPQVRLRLAAGRAWSLAFGKGFIACGTERGLIEVWNSRDGKGRVLSAKHRRRVHSTIVLENLLITGSEDGTVLVWKTFNWELVASLNVCDTGMSCICAWTDSRGEVRIAATCADRKIRILKIESGTFNFTEDSVHPILETLHRGPVHAICKVGPYLVSGGSDEQLLAWDLHGNGDDNIPSRIIQLLNLGDIRSFDVRNDALAVACGKKIVLYDKSLRKSKVLKGHYSNIRSVAFSPNGDLLASACSDGSIRLWKLSEEFCLEKWEGHSSFLVCALAFEGSNLVSVGSDGTIAIWSVPRS